MSAPKEKEISLHTMSGEFPGMAWVHTHGMAEFDYPDLECYWSPVETAQEAEHLLRQVAHYLIKFRPHIQLGSRIELEEPPLLLQFIESVPQLHHDFGRNEVLRLQSVTTGREGVHGFRRLIGINRHSALGYNSHALSLQLRGEARGAAREYMRALAEEPDNIYTLNNYGALLLSLGEIEQGMQLLEIAAETEPQYPPLHNNLGNAYLRQGRVEEAVAEYERAVSCNRSYAMPHRNLALCHHLMGQLDKAVEEYRTYFRLAPAGTQDADAHFNLGVMLAEQGREEEAIKEYEKALADNPDYPRALNNLGLIYFSQRQIEKAVEFYEKALEADEAFTLARYNLGLACAAQGESSKAIEHFERVCALDPENVQAASNLGVMYTSAGRFDDAIRIFEGLIQKEPDQPTLHFNLALSYRGKGLHEQAGAEFRKVISLEPPQSPRARRARRELQFVM